jgi:hypothetical protein
MRIDLRLDEHSLQTSGRRFLIPGQAKWRIGRRPEFIRWILWQKFVVIVFSHSLTLNFHVDLCLIHLFVPLQIIHSHKHQVEIWWLHKIIAKKVPDVLYRLLTTSVARNGSKKLKMIGFRD